MTSRSKHKPKGKRRSAGSAAQAGGKQVKAAAADRIRPAKPHRTARPERSRRARAQASKSEACRRPRPESIAPRLRGDDDDPTEDVGSELGIGSPVVPPTAPASEPPEPPRIAAASSAEVADQIRALEARLDNLIRRANLPTDDDDPPPSISEQVTARARDVVERIASVVPPAAGAPADVTRLFTNPYYIRTWGPRGPGEASGEIDAFGFDPQSYARARPVLEFLYRRYFRVETRGIESVPAQGRAVIVANHAGTVPLDGAMLRIALSLDHPSKRDLRWLAEDFVVALPFVGPWFSRVGAVRACQENAERLLDAETLIAVFPEGARGLTKLFRNRHRLERFERDGYVRLCLRTRSPMIPCAVIGAEETSPVLHRVGEAARALGLPPLPLTPTFPWLGPLGLIPAPSKWTIRFGEPIDVDEYGPEAAEDRALVSRLSERVQTAIEDMLREGLGQRKSVWFG